MGGNIEAFSVLLPRRRDGGASCVGPARSHRTCHTEVKPAWALLPTAPPHFHGPASKPHPSLFWEPTRHWGWGRAGSPSWNGEWDRGVGPQGSRTWRVDRAGWQLPWCSRLAPTFSRRAAQTACGTSGLSSAQSSMAPTLRAGATGGCPTMLVSVPHCSAGSTPASGAAHRKL